jgi:S1-C subfamily serine protease
MRGIQVGPGREVTAQLIPRLLESGRLGGMEFATLSDRLGDYFGVDEGVLVVRAGADAPFSLQDGDVILSIDGRAPTDAQHAGRILRSYQPGEKVKLRVQRDRKAIDLNATAPGGRD